MISSFLTIQTSPKRGRGMFTTKNISKGTIIEVSPVVVLTPKERKTIEKTLLFHYVFEWGNDKKSAAMALGYISLYNHSYDANCEYEMEFGKKLMTIKTVRSIKKGEELFINYNAKPDDKTKVWFDTK
ncbi:MAG: SET domain-containing protein-lysine N-methyltransferase [Parafilimonas sp.]|nr:SET domain-containing protein-lysine N-methyltransferase [Parafilimonas sp.]